MPTVRIILTDTPTGPRVRMEIEGKGESRAVELALIGLREIRRQQRRRGNMKEFCFECGAEVPEEDNPKGISGDIQCRKCRDALMAEIESELGEFPT